MHRLSLALVAIGAALSIATGAVAQTASPKQEGTPLSAKKTDAKSSKNSSSAKATPAVQPEWPVANAPTPLEGSILPAKRIVAFYGNPLSKRMGILGELDSTKMLAKLDSEVIAWNKADPDHPVQPALHLIAVVASADPGPSGKYRTRMDSALIRRVYNWAKSRNALLFLDVQVGTGTLQEELPRLMPWLKNPDVHLAIDPEFSMKGGEKPGTIIGTFDANDINYASSLLQELVTKENLPPKVLIVHRFRRNMLTGYKKIKLDPRVQMVINMDGWGTPSQKRDSYREYVWKYPVEYTGFKLFYHNDRRLKGSMIMSPADVLALDPRPIYIQYQ
ncbi:MAG TPA: hypothetical protein VGM82_06785 [Gemmatimonadaceae bacterium]|jgi:hypothetical protein